jgi:hypothetical protein
MGSHNHNNEGNSFTCPMHPKVKGKQGDKCPECGMELVAEKRSSKEYEVSLKSSPQIFEAGKPTKVEFTIKKGGLNTPLDISHEMKIHLMVLSKDLKWFHHIHPEEQQDGSYTVTETFPYGGNYMLFYDFKPSGSNSVLEKQEIEVKGAPDTGKSDFTDKFIAFANGYKVTLENGNDFKTNQTQSFRITVEKEGKRLLEKDIQQYLGANAHIVMIGKDDMEFLHIHPVTNEQYPIYAETLIQNAGVYRIWVQFQTNGKVHTADFTVKVREGTKDQGNEKPTHKHQH